MNRSSMEMLFRDAALTSIDIIMPRVDLPRIALLHRERPNDANNGLAVREMPAPSMSAGRDMSARAYSAEP